MQLSGYRDGLGSERSETVAAEIVMNYSETLTLEDIRQYLAGRLARYKIPRLVYSSRTAAANAHWQDSKICAARNAFG